MEFRNSINRHEYPDNEIVDNITYNFLRIPFEDVFNNLPLLRISSGSYSGTNVYGKNNPNSLTFDFEPKLIFVGGRYQFWAINGFYFSILFGSSSLGSQYIIQMLWEGNTVKWYSTESADKQLNLQGSQYFYIALG